MKRALCLVVSVTIMLLFSSAFAGKRETKTVQVGDEFTVYTTPQYRMKNVVWEWDYNVLEAVGSIGAYSTSAKFRAKKASPSAGVVIQATTYYYVSSGSYTYVAKDFDSYTIYVNDNTTVSFAKSEYQIEYETPGQSSATYIEAIPSNSSYAGSYNWSASDYDYIYLNGDGKRACIHPRKVGQTTLTVTLDNGSSAQCRVKVLAPEPKSVDIDAYMSLVVGSGQSLKPTLSPAYAETTYSWTSDNPSVASVSSSGYVTGKSVGNTYVRVRTANGKTDACQVTVSAKQPESVSLPKSLSMVIGDSQTLDAIVSPADASYNLTWKSSDENVATVSSEGKVIAVSKGSAAITVSTQNGKSASCGVVVEAPLPASLTLSSNELSLYEGQENRIEAVVLPENAEFSIEWVSSDKNVATISDGVVSAKQAGECIINAKTSNGLTAECSITVLKNIIKPESISIPATAQLIAGESLSLDVTTFPSDAEAVISWSSSNRNVALVNDGTVNAISEGECIITATTDNGKSSTCAVSVSRKVIKPTSVVIPKTMELEVGGTQIINPEILPSNAETTLTWMSSNPDIARVDNGIIVGIKPGSCIVTVTTDNGLEASCTVTVKRAEPSEVSVKPATLNLTEGDAYSISVSVYPSDAEQTVLWSSDDETVAVVSDSGLVTALSQGSCIITASTSNGKSATCAVSVSRKVIKPTSVAIPKTMELEVGGTQIINPEILPSNAETTLTWMSSNPDIAGVDNGSIVGIKPGSCIVTVTTDNGHEASCTVTVKRAEPSEVSVNPATLNLTEGDVYSISVSVYPSDAEQSVLWSTDDETVAVVSDSGLVTALSQGSCIITASTSNGKSATCAVSVSRKVIKPTSVAIPETMELEVGSTQLINPEILPSNAETTLTWMSSEKEVATVENGLVSALAAGKCLIIVRTNNGLEASCEVTVIQKNKPDDPIVNSDWVGNYSIKSTVIKYDDANYDYPSEYSFTIDDVEGKLYVTSLIGLDCTKTYPYTGIPVRIESETSAILELDMVNDAGSRTNNGDYIGGLLLLTANPEYAYDKLGNITLSKTDDGGIQISNFYVFFFGLDSDFEYRKDAFYTDSKSYSDISVGLTNAESDDFYTNEIEIFNLDGIRVYKGKADADILLKSDIYIIRRGNKTTKTFIR